MGFLLKFIARLILNGLALYAAGIYFPNFVITGGLETLLIGALVLAVLYAFLRPILRLIATPLVWLTFGLFNIVISVLILWSADQMLTQVAINDLTTLFWVSIIVAAANTVF